MRVIVLGCGSSSSVPSIRCLMSKKSCIVCEEAYDNPLSKNRRGNPSILVCLEENCVLIDCGKTFREAVLRHINVFRKYKLQGLVLTHEHADASLGIDDLRDIQQWEVMKDEETGEFIKSSTKALDVYCSQQTYDSMAVKFDYLFPSQDTVYRWTAQLTWKVFEAEKTFTVGGLEFKPLPVLHGEDFVSMGFELGQEANVRFIYLSDVSRIPPETMAYLKSRPIDVLMIDGLTLQAIHGTHMNLQQAKDVIRELKPLKSYITGMSHDFDYHVLNPQLLMEELEIEMAYDGLEIPLVDS